MRKIFLNDLPKWGKNNNGNEGTINWRASIGCCVKFQYNDIKGEIVIVDYKSKEQRLYIQYQDKDIFKIHPSSFTRCALGRLLGIVTDEFKVKIGTHFKNDKRDLIIISREYRINNRKWYQYRCNICNWDEGWVEETRMFLL